MTLKWIGKGTWVGGIAMVLAGCTVNMPVDDGDGGAGGSGGAGGEMRICPEPTVTDDAMTGDWSEPNERDSFTITVPDDAAGGILQVDLRADHPELIPMVIIRHVDYPDGAALLSGSAQGTEDEQLWTARFMALPGATYELEVAPFFNAPPDAHPVSYELTYSFEGLDDCYEANDTVEEASTIGINEEVDAVFAAGLFDNSSGNALDHYRFTVVDEQDLRFRLLDDVATVGCTLTVFDDGGVVASGGGLETGLYDIDLAGLPSGDYVLELRLGSAAPEQRAAQGEADPAHWTDRYRFVVEAR